MSKNCTNPRESIREAFYDDGHILDSAIDKISEIREEVIEKLGFAPVFVIQQKTERFMPRINLVGDEDVYTVDIELPGMEVKEINLTVSRNRMIVSGVRSRINREGKTLFLEQMEGRFSRVLHFEAPVDGRNSEAFLQHGVLHVVLRKTKVDAKTRQEFDIEIKHHWQSESC